MYVAALESFGHGANDTANSTGPLSAIWFGIWSLGYRVKGLGFEVWSSGFGVQ